MLLLLNIEKLSTEFCESAYNNVAKHFLHDKDKKLKKDSVCGRLLLTYALNEYYRKRDFAVKVSDTGKPFILDDRLFFNISHSGNYVLCAISNDEIGCDVQIHSKYNEKVAKRFYHKNEKELLQQSDNKDEDFIKLWTLKESILKNVGDGLSGGLDTYDFSTYISKQSFCAYGFFFNSVDISGAHLSVCSLKAETELIEIDAERIVDFFKRKGKFYEKNI